MSENSEKSQLVGSQGNILELLLLYEPTVQKLKNIQSTEKVKKKTKKSSKFDELEQVDAINALNNCWLMFC